MTSEAIGDYVIGGHPSTWHYLILSRDAMRKYNIQSNPQLDEHYKKILEKAEKLDELYNTGYMAVEKKVWKMVREENKQLKEMVENTQKWFDWCKDEMTITMVYAYEQLLATKEEKK